MAELTLITPGDGENAVKLSITDDAESTPLSLLFLFACDTYTSHEMPSSSIFLVVVDDVALVVDILLLILLLLPESMLMLVVDAAATDLDDVRGS